MSLLRTLLLRGSESPALSRLVGDRGRARRVVRRFLPGETLDAALDAAARQAALGIGTTLAYLGATVTDAASAAAVTRHYLDALERVRARGLPCEFSLKLSRLGLDRGPVGCLRVLDPICARAAETRAMLWLDGEGSPRVPAMLEVFHALRARGWSVGLCFQAGLRRTPNDVEPLVALGTALRLVKGSYREPPAAAFQRRSAVVEAFFRLGVRLLAPDARAAGVRAVFATHDRKLIARLQAHAGTLGLGAGAFECHQLYGLRRGDQRRLVAQGQPVRVLIGYGSSWFAWYMRRLAERPANVWFVARNVFA